MTKNRILNRTRRWLKRGNTVPQLFSSSYLDRKCERGPKGPLAGVGRGGGHRRTSRTKMEYHYKNIFSIVFWCIFCVIFSHFSLVNPYCDLHCDRRRDQRRGASCQPKWTTFFCGLLTKSKITRAAELGSSNFLVFWKAVNTLLNPIPTFIGVSAR